MSTEIGVETEAEVLAQTGQRQRRTIDAAPRGVGALAVVLLALYPFVSGDVTINRFTDIALFGLVAVGTNFTMGVAGEFAIGQMGLFAAAAYTSAILTTNHGWNFWPAAVVATLLAAVIGVIVAAPGLRVGGWPFAMTSLLVAVVIPDLIGQWTSLTGGSQGLNAIPFPSIGSFQFSFADIYILALVSTLR